MACHQVVAADAAADGADAAVAQPDQDAAGADRGGQPEVAGGAVPLQVGFTWNLVAAPVR